MTMASDETRNVLQLFGTAVTSLEKAIDDRAPMDVVMKWDHALGDFAERRTLTEIAEVDHAGEIDEQVWIAEQEAIEASGRAFAPVGEHDFALPVGGQRPIERGLGLVGQLVVDHDRHPELAHRIQDPAEHGAVGVAVDQAPAHLAHVNLAHDSRLAAVELKLELAHRVLGRRIRKRQSRDHAVRVFAARGRQPRRVFLLQAADAQEHDLEHVVALHRGDVRVDRGGARQMRMRVDQRAVVVGAPRWRADEEHAQHETDEGARRDLPHATF